MVSSWFALHRESGISLLHLVKLALLYKVEVQLALKRALLAQLDVIVAKWASQSRREPLFDANCVESVLHTAVERGHFFPRTEIIKANCTQRRGRERARFERQFYHRVVQGEPPCINEQIKEFAGRKDVDN